MKIFVSGLLNVETSLQVEDFPINYSPIEYPFFGVSTSVSGVGYNIAKALQTLGDDFDLYSFIGNDNNGELIRTQLSKDKINDNFISNIKELSTPESVIIHDKNGRRKIYCDLKNIQDLELRSKANINPKNYDLAILTNINFSRPLIKTFKDSGVLIASDVHVLINLDDEYNQDFLNNSDILFLSNDGCLGKEKEFIKNIYNRFHNAIIVCGCGAEGALLYHGKSDEFVFEKAVAPRGVNNTVGAGDALFSSFLHFYQKTRNFRKSLSFAVIFAGFKVSSSGGASGFVDEKTVLEYMEK